MSVRGIKADGRKRIAVLENELSHFAEVKDIYGENSRTGFVNL